MSKRKQSRTMAAAGVVTQGAADGDAGEARGSRPTPSRRAVAVTRVCGAAGAGDSADGETSWAMTAEVRAGLASAADAGAGVGGGASGEVAAPSAFPAPKAEEHRKRLSTFEVELMDAWMQP